MAIPKCEEATTVVGVPLVCSFYLSVLIDYYVDTLLLTAPTTETYGMDATYRHHVNNFSLIFVLLEFA